MRCVSFCTADSYKLPAIVTFFKNQGVSCKQYRKVLHIVDPVQNGDIFVFGYGCVVTWGLTHSRELWILKQIEPFAINLLSLVESDCFVFHRDNRTEMISHPRFNADIILLDSDNSQIKLAISYGIAKSIQLESYETEVQKLIDKNTPFFADLLKRGSIPLSRKEIARRVGEIFVARSQINLNSEYLGAPEYFWEHPNLETYYIMSEKFLDISRRVTALNQKLDVLHELFEMLMTQLQNRHSNFLEMVIILLIFFEVVWSIFLYLS